MNEAAYTRRRDDGRARLAGVLVDGMGVLRRGRRSRAGRRTSLGQPTRRAARVLIYVRAARLVRLFRSTSRSRSATASSAATADSTRPRLLEIFGLLGPGRADRRRVPAPPRLDCFANLNSTVIGDYGTARVRLLGAVVQIRDRRVALQADFVILLGACDEELRSSGSTSPRPVTDSGERRREARLQRRRGHGGRHRPRCARADLEELARATPSPSGSGCWPALEPARAAHGRAPSASPTRSSSGARSRRLRPRRGSAP